MGPIQELPQIYTVATRLTNDDFREVEILGVHVPNVIGQHLRTLYVYEDDRPVEMGFCWPNLVEGVLATALYLPRLEADLLSEAGTYCIWVDLRQYGPGKSYPSHESAINEASRIVGGAKLIELGPKFEFEKLRRQHALNACFYIWRLHRFPKK